MKWRRRETTNRHVLLAEALRGQSLEPIRLVSLAVRNGISHQQAIETLAIFEGEFFEYTDGKWSLKMDLSHITTIDQLIEEARRLRSEYERAEARFLLFLMAIETQLNDLWRTMSGCSTYDAFLQSSQIINPARYRNFCAGALRAGNPDSVLKIGADATIQLGAFKAPTEEGVRQFIDTASKFTQVHEGGTASEQTAVEWRKRLDGSVPKVVRVASRLSQLEAENQALKNENRELKKKLSAAEKRLTKLEGKSAAPTAEA